MNHTHILFSIPLGFKIQKTEKQKFDLTEAKSFGKDTEAMSVVSPMIWFKWGGGGGVCRMKIQYPYVPSS